MQIIPRRNDKNVIESSVVVTWFRQEEVGNDVAKWSPRWELLRDESTNVGQASSADGLEEVWPGHWGVGSIFFFFRCHSLNSWKRFILFNWFRMALLWAKKWHAKGGKWSLEWFPFDRKEGLTHFTAWMFLIFCIARFFGTNEFNIYISLYYQIWIVQIWLVDCLLKIQNPFKIVYGSNLCTIIKNMTAIFFLNMFKVIINKKEKIIILEFWSSEDIWK